MQENCLKGIQEFSIGICRNATLLSLYIIVTEILRQRLKIKPVTSENVRPTCVEDDTPRDGMELDTAEDSDVVNDS